MRDIDEFNITQAVIARNAAAGDARVRELMTSLVQHVHAFAREAKLTEAEWSEGMRFLAECGRRSDDRRDEFARLSDALGLSMLVTAQSHRVPRGCTEAACIGPFQADGAPHCEHGDDIAGRAQGEPCYVRAQVRALDGRPIAGAEVRVWQCGADGVYNGAQAHSEGGHMCGAFTTGADGGLHFRSIVAAPHPVARDGPVVRMLHALGRHAWRPAHLHFIVTAPGHEPLVTQVLRAGDPYLDSDAAFGVRASLVADWIHHGPGLAPDGQQSAVPFTTVDFVFVLNNSQGDKP